MHLKYIYYSRHCHPLCHPFVILLSSVSSFCHPFVIRVILFIILKFISVDNFSYFIYFLIDNNKYEYSRKLSKFVCSNYLKEIRI